MDRRHFLGITGTVSAGMLFGGMRFLQSNKVNTVLRGGKCFYQNQWQILDVGIDDAGKLIFAPANTLEGNSVFDIGGKIVSPGFIDILADNASSPASTFKIFEKYKITDGVTTALQMHGGSPDCAAYYDKFGALPHYINFGVSTFVMQIRNKQSGINERKKQVEKCLKEGALGVSHSIEYQPTPFEETVEYAKLAKKYNRPFFMHLRHSSEGKELEGVDEAIKIARESGANVHINHLHSTGGTYKMAEALYKIKSARNEGLNITCCVYPYSFWATYLHSMRFAEGWQKRYNITYSDLQVVGTGEKLTAATFAKYRKIKKLVAVPEGTMLFSETIDLALKEDFCMIGSDGGIEFEKNANSHPRGAGCFATAINHCLSIGIPLEKALDKMTTLPRKLISPALQNRGILQDGAIADLTIFDEKAINGKATVANPNQFSDGIEHVFVNGKLAYSKGQLIGTFGAPIKYQNF
jgi:N-acyl-D-aspartate/D-glutamate deacylase